MCHVRHFHSNHDPVMNRGNRRLPCWLLAKKSNPIRDDNRAFFIHSDILCIRKFHTNRLHTINLPDRINRHSSMEFYPPNNISDSSFR